MLATVDHALLELSAGGEDFGVDNVKRIIKKEKEWNAKLERETFSDPNIENTILELQRFFTYGAG